MKTRITGGKVQAYLGREEERRSEFYGTPELELRTGWGRGGEAGFQPEQGSCQILSLALELSDVCWINQDS